MASPGSPSPSTSKDTNSGYYYLVLAIAVMALLLTFNVVAVGCCARCSLIRAVKNFLRSLGIPLDPAEDEQISQLIPASKYKKEQWTGTNTECPVCLTTFMDGEEVRQLPECKHSFHAPCIDMWLRSHSSCPLCRAHVLLLQGLPHPRGAEVVAATEERWPPVDSSSAAGMTGVVISML